MTKRDLFNKTRSGGYWTTIPADPDKIERKQKRLPGPEQQLINYFREVASSAKAVHVITNDEEFRRRVEKLAKFYDDVETVRDVNNELFLVRR